jgi:hypothetical protein
MKTLPTHTAFVVVEPKEGSDRKASWHEVGLSGPTRTAKASTLSFLRGCRSAAAWSARSASRPNPSPELRRPPIAHRQAGFCYRHTDTFLRYLRPSPTGRALVYRIASTLTG